MTRVKRTVNQYVDHAPTAVKLTDVQRLMDIINDRIDAGTRKPVPMPDNQQDAAKWFIGILEDRLQFEVDELKTVTKSDNDKSKIGSKYWFLPYQDRIAECLISYYRLPHADQVQIVEWSTKKIMWRGDSMKFMKTRVKVDMSKIDKTKIFSMMKTIIAKARTCN